MLQFIDLWPLKAVNQPEVTISAGSKVFIFEDVWLGYIVGVWQHYHQVTLACDSMSIEDSNPCC